MLQKFIFFFLLIIYICTMEAAEIKELIKKTGLKQKFIAEKLGIGSHYLSHLLSGRQPIKQAMEDKILLLLGEPLAGRNQP